MAATDADFAFLLAAVRRLLNGIRGEIAPRLVTDAPLRDEDRGTILARHVNETLTAIERRVDSEEARYPSRRTDLSKAAGSRALRFYAQLVWATHDALRWLRPELGELDLGALYFADEAALSLIGPGIEVVPVEAPEYMYSTSSWPFRWLFEEYLQEAMPEGERPIVLAFPAHERHTMLLHCLFVHELGHAAVDHHELVADIIAAVTAEHFYNAEVTKLAASYGETRANFAESAQDRAERWIEELLCDGLGFCYLGPAYLFAFAEMGLSVSWSEPGKDHPSMAVRTRLLAEMAREGGWADYLESRVPEIWRWLELAAGAAPATTDLLSSLIEQAVGKVRSNISTAAKDTVGVKTFTAADWADQDDHLSDLLVHDVLPVERTDGAPATHPEILLAAWLQAIDKHKASPAAISAAIGEKDYQRFVAKALEMATVVRTWEEVTPDASQA